MKSGKTVFNTSDLSVLWKISNRDTLKSKIHYLTQNKKIQKLHYGIYALNEEYNKYELAGKLKHPSYVSLETVLRKKRMHFSI